MHAQALRLSSLCGGAVSRNYVRVLEIRCTVETWGKKSGVNNMLIMDHGRS